MNNNSNSNSAAGATLSSSLQNSSKSNKRLRPPTSQHLASPGGQKKVQTAFGRRLSPSANLMASGSAGGSTPQHNFNRVNGSLGLSGRAGTSSVSSLGINQQQQQAPTTTRVRKTVTGRSPEVSKTKATSGKQATTVAFETWVNSICPPQQNQSAQTTRKSAKAANTTKHLAPQSHAQAFNNAQTQSSRKDDPLALGDLNRAPDMSASEVVVMDVNAFNVTNDFYPSALEDSSSSMIIQPEGYLSTTVLQTMTNMDEPDLQSILEERQVPRSHVELDKINQQLAEEYKYVEDLRRDLRQAEQALKKKQGNANTTAVSSIDYQQQWQPQQQTQQQTTRKNAITQKDQSSVALMDESRVTVNSADFWSESQSRSGKTKKFTMEPPPEKLKDNSRKLGFKSSLVATSKKGATSSTSELTEDMTASSGRFAQQDSFGSESGTPYAQQRAQNKRPQQQSIGNNNLSLFLDDQIANQKGNQRKLTAKKAQSPTVKNSITQRFGQSSTAVMSPSNAIMSASKNISKQGQRDLMSPTHPPISQHTANSVQVSANRAPPKQISFIGTGLFKKGQQLDGVSGGPLIRVAQPSTDVCHAFQGAAGYNEREFHSSQEGHGRGRKTMFRNGDEDERLQYDVEASDDTNKRTDMLMAPYDFEKYEMMSTSHQIQDLLSKKLDTPKGSSASDGEEQTPQVVEEDDEYLYGKLNSQMMNPNKVGINSMISQGQHGRTDELIGTSPEPKHKYMNSMFTKQRTERKVSATNQMLKVSERTKQVQSPPSRNLQQMQLTFRESTKTMTTAMPVNMQTQNTKGSSSFLGKLHYNEATQSPPMKQNKQARFDHQNQTQTKRSGILQRGTSSNSIGKANVQQQSQEMLGGSPAVPALRKAHRPSHKSSTSITGMPVQPQQQRQLQPQHVYHHQQSMTLTDINNGVSSGNSHIRGRLNSPNLQQQEAQRMLGSPPLMTKMQSDGANAFQTVKQVARNHVARQVASPRKTFNNGEESGIKVHRQHQFQAADQELANDAVLQFLLQEEEWLDQLQDLAGAGNFLEMQAQGLLLPRCDTEQRRQILYASLFSHVNLPKQRPRVFSMQLCIYVKMAVQVTEILVLDQPSMRKFASKLDDVLKNCHQNFLIMVDFILSGIGEIPIKKSIDFKLLKTVVTKKLDPNNARNRLTAFRQKNELSRAFLKRIACELTDLQIAKQATAVQHFCTGMLDTLKMTIEETGMDVTKNQANQKRIVTQLDKIYDQAIEASRAMKMASKKAHMKKNQQHERKVKSVMRGQKVVPQQYQSNLAQKYVSPPPKRMRQQQVPNALESRLQAHLFGSKNTDISVTDATTQPYLHTVEETEYTEASPSKSLLQLESQPSEQPPPQVQPEMPDNISTLTYVRPLESISAQFEESSTTNPTHTAVVKKSKTMKRRASPIEKPTTNKTFKRASTLKESGSGDIRHIKTTLVPNSKKQSIVSSSRQSSRSPSTQHQRMSSSPSHQQASQEKKLQSIVLQQQKQQQQSQPTGGSNLLPENIAFIRANSGFGTYSPGEVAQSAFSNNQNHESSSAFSLNLMAVSGKKQSDHMPHQTLTKYKSLSQMPRADGTSTKLPRFQQREAVPTVISSKTARRGTLQKTKSTQSQHMPFQLHTTRSRMNTTVQNTSSSIDKIKRMQRQGNNNLLTTKPITLSMQQSSEIKKTVVKASSQPRQKKQDSSTPQEITLTSEQKQSRVSIIDDMEVHGFALQSIEKSNEMRHSELPILNSHRTFISGNEDQDVNPFAVSFVEQSQTKEISLFKSPRNQEGQKDFARAQDGEAISSVAQTVKTPVRDSLEHNSSSKLENEESANFSLTPCNKDDYFGGSSESSHDDVDEDGSLILGRSSEQISSSLTSSKPQQTMSAAVGAAITPRDYYNEAAIELQRKSAASVVMETLATTRSIAQSNRDLVVKDSPFATAKAFVQVQQTEQNKKSIVPRLSKLETLDKFNKSPPDEPENYLSESQIVQDDETSIHQTKEQVGPFEQQMESPADGIRMKFSANNFITPKNENDFNQSTAERPSNKIPNDSSISQVSLTRKAYEMPKIQVDQADFDFGEEKQSVEEKIEDGDGTMKSIVEELLCSKLAGRRSSTRINSLLFEEDSMQIKREMMRERQEKQRISKDQRISIKFSNVAPGARRQTARRLTSSHVMPIPSSARNKISQYRHTSAFSGSDEVFGTASQLAKKQQQIRSQSLIELDSAKELSASIKLSASVKLTTHAYDDQYEPHSTVNMSSSVFDAPSGANTRPAAFLPPFLDTAGFSLITQNVTPRESEAIEPKADSSEASLAANSPILKSVKIQSPWQEESATPAAVENIVTPSGQFDKDDHLTPTLAPASVDQPNIKASEKGVKSAANAAYDAFYQKLIPSQNSKEQDLGAEALQIRSRSMVTSFLDIPEALPSLGDREEEIEQRNSYGYSNLGTFQTPERGQLSNASPTNLFRSDIIPENSAEEDHSQGSPDLNLPNKQNSMVMKRQESFKTNGFESIDSFVQLENQLQNRGDSLVKDCMGNQSAVSIPEPTPTNQVIREEAAAEEGDCNATVMQTEMMDEEQDAIEAELAILRAQVKIPYLPPIDTTLIDEDEVYTLVLDLDETLIHYECDDEDGDYYLIRPGAIKFLKELALYYEIVIFTAAMPEYADKILDNLDENGFMIKHRLYRQHTTPTEDYAIKDLRVLGRQLERTIIVDNLAENFQVTTPNNGVWVESWYDDMQDQVLPRLSKFLAELVEEQVPDVRKFLTQEIKDEIIYACLERNQPIPSIAEISRRAHSASLDR